MIESRGEGNEGVGEGATYITDISIFKNVVLFLYVPKHM